MKKLENKTLQPQLRKKNGVWLKVLVPALCVVAGAGTMAGLIYGVPAVNNAFITNKDNTNNSNSNLQTQIENLENEISKKDSEIIAKNELIVNKELQIQNLNSEIVSLNEKLELCSNYDEVVAELEQKTIELEQALANSETDSETIQKLQSEVDTLTTQKNELQNEVDTLKEMLGDNINYAELVVSLQSQLTSTTEQLNSANAELAQLKVDKEQLSVRVEELETELAEVKEQLNNYVNTENIDKLNIASYDGTWYKNGTFEDYLIIENGVVGRGNNVDSGVLNVLYKEMYMFLNSTGGQVINLSENGTKITLEDGTEYTKFLINTLETTSINMGVIAGEYSYETERIVLNNDNTASYFDGNNTYYGAFTATATEKNVGGNITLTHYITLTINKNDVQEIMEFSLVNNNRILNKKDGKNFIGIDSIETMENTKIIDPSGGASYYFVYKLNNNYSSISASYTPLYKKSNQFGSGMSFGTSRSTSSTSPVTLTLSNLNGIQYLKIGANNHNSSYGSVTTLYSIAFTNFDCELIRIEKLKDDKFLELSNELKSKIIASEVYYKTCSTISDYYTGSWSNEAVSVDLTSETATVTPAGVEEPITATEYVVTAKTDGTNIIHTVTIKYIDAEEQTHTISFEIVNNATTAQNGALDEEELILNKA